MVKIKTTFSVHEGLNFRAFNSRVLKLKFLSKTIIMIIRGQGWDLLSVLE